MFGEFWAMHRANLLDFKSAENALNEIICLAVWIDVAFTVKMQMQNET